MALFCWVYVAALFVYEKFGAQPVPEGLYLAVVTAFPLASVILFLIGRWHLRNPATYRAIITDKQFMVEYPGSEQWSFCVNVGDIKRFENRQTLSHAGRGIPQHGILMKDGSFHHITMNYGNNIRKMYKAVKQVNPEVTFPYRVNQKARGLGLDKDYDN
ncbi:hypothetical protein [Marinobacter sp. F3R08]|uniref:hypothetical protein n=1 Tax=Marinobacter sp. F3R08 TaxID=2841559 RepID=UPI001C08359A|nr:hypothetical protein [Marinobacter sp. F3R08]MBU2952998.1 hypothetical protein [Marinobacter sp. F3R08]